MLLEAQAAAGPAPEPGGALARLGSVARLTPERVRAALGLVRRGVPFRLDLPLGQPDPPLFGRTPMRHEVAGTDGFDSWDDRIDGMNTQQGSHWDALRHLLGPGGAGYAGRPPQELGIDLWSAGICGRAVLVDLGEGLGLARGEGREISGAEVDACARRQGVELRAGDVLLLRTGWLAGHLALEPGERPPEVTAPGLAPDDATARWLEERRLAAIAADNPGLEAVPTPPKGRMLHDRMLPQQGLAVGELFWLEDLCADCRADGVWEGLLVSVPLNLPGACASPANAVVLK
jgi:kynurenine formamidase